MIFTLDTTKGRVVTDKPLTSNELEKAFLLLEFTYTQLRARDISKVFESIKTITIPKDIKGKEINWDAFLDAYNANKESNN